MSHQGGPSTSLFTAIPGRPKIQGQVQRRSDYWRMQAKRLVAIVSEYRDDDSHNHISGTSDGIGAPTISKESRTAGIPRERLMILVDMIFDPLLVALENRRAIINCARYVSAEVDFVHKDTINLLKQTDPNHPLLRGDNRDVYLGPYLTIAQPHMNQSSGWAAFNEVTPAVTTEPLATPPPTPGTMDESPSPMATQGEKDEHYWLTHVEPPARLRSFFQRLLWHRCLSDLVRIYNQIQERHIPTPASGQTIRDCKASSPFSSSPSPPLFAVSDSTAQYKRPEDNSCTTSLPSHTPALAATTQGPHQTQEAIYPFCCKAHSLVFSHSPNTLNGPFSSATTTASLFSASWMTSSRYTLFGLRTKLKQAMNDLQRAYRQFQWTLSALGFDQTPLDLQRIVQPAFRPSKLVFCNAISIKEPSMAILPKGSSLQDQKQQRQTKNDDQVTDHEHHKDRESHYASHRLSEEELLVRRRYLIDDAVRRDNLMKQELLGLCHIACGLFTVDTANPQGTTADGNTRRSSRYQPVTLMSLLRQGSPWRKGVWQEGEWRSSAIELDPMAAPNDPSSSSIPWNAQEAEAEQGEWQKICLATIQFLIREDLAWGGNKANEELSKLKVTNYGSAWVYHE
ncbi:hypothetical protein BGW41_004965 [Actinomortierella wolfii]|nr:hypothetical protein BGW41_004965 [Actinomortierella wolfii]